MRVLIWAAFYYPHVGGYETDVRELAEQLVTRGHSVTVVTCNTNHSPKHEQLQGVSVNRIPCLLVLNGLYPIPLPSLSLLNIMLHRKLDVEMTQTRFFLTSVLGAVHSLLHRKPLIHTERGSCHAVVPSRIVSALCKLFDHAAGTFIVRLSKKVTGVSSSACEFANHIGANNAVRISNGIRLSMVVRRNRDSSVPNILFVGRLIYAKGVQDLIAATDYCRRAWGRCTLTIAGDGPYRKTLESMVSKWGTDTVFLGEVSRDQLPSVYREASVFVNPSYSEGLPTSVAEAMAARVPVIATDVGGTSELVRHNHTGVLVRPGNVEELIGALLLVLKYPESTEQLVEYGYEHIKRNFAWDGIIDQYCKLLEDVSDGH